jgi:hypothetical protein
MMLHWSPRGADQLFGTPHISAFSAVDILSAAIVLARRSPGQAAAQVKEGGGAEERGGRLSLAKS